MTITTIYRFLGLNIGLWLDIYPVTNAYSNFIFGLNTRNKKTMTKKRLNFS